MRSMPLLKTGHQPKTHMKTQLSIAKKHRRPYEESVTDPKIKMDEKAVRAVIAAWARKQSSSLGKDWMYAWNLPNKKRKTTK
jgi:hypothetical protein